MNTVLALLLIYAGVGFFLTGSIGLLRLPDLNARLHALTKADNLGLGLLVAGLILLSGQWRLALTLLLVWLLVLAAGAVSAYLIAHYARQESRP